MRDCFGRGVWTASRFLAFALVILSCTLPVSANTYPPNHSVKPDGLFQAPLLLSAVALPSTDTGSALPSEVDEDGLAFGALRSEVTGTDYSQQWPWFDDRSETGAYGVRRFTLLAILFGAVVRFLTSATFYRWAADVFGPYNWD
jgi:hypothetical protein